MILPPVIRKLILAVVIAVAVGLGCILLGGVLDSLKADIAVQIGDDLRTWGWVIGVLAGLWYFFTGA